MGALITSALAFAFLAPSYAMADDVSLILNNPKGRKAPTNSCDREVCLSILKEITSAKSSIDFAIYGMRNQSEILNALKKAKARGVKVRGVIDRDSEGKNYYSSTEELVTMIGKDNISSDLQSELMLLGEKARDEARRQAKFGAYKPSCDRPTGFAGPLQCLGYDLGDTCLMAGHASRDANLAAGYIMHHKFFVFDNKRVWMGSTNISDSGTGGYNANLVSIIKSPTIAQWYTDEFEIMFKGQYHAQKPSTGMRSLPLKPGLSVDIGFSPQDKPITNAVRPLIQKAKKRIDIAIFFLTHKGITRDLIKAHRRGVKVRIILDATAATNGYTKHDLLRAAGIPVKVEHWGGKMHMKSAVIDSKHVIVGSMNWTSAGEGGNDENTMIIHSKKHARKYETFFNNLWNQIPDTFLKNRPDPESIASSSACFDGVDNDYDHMADGKDDGCSKNPPPLSPLPPWRIIPKTDGRGLVKLLNGVYYLPKHKKYDTITPEGYACSANAAKDAGYKKARWR